jgi:molecular chaperone GrpE
MNENQEVPAAAAPDATDAAKLIREAAEAKIAELEAALAGKEGEFAAFKDGALRQLAEYRNQKERAERDAADRAKYAAAAFARDLLSVADNLDRALGAVPKEAPDPALAAMRAGVEMTGRELAAVLDRHGVKRVDPAGQKFDPNLHQAMYEVPTAEHPPGTVVQVMQPGYVLHDRLLRAAMVGVAKSPPAAEAAPDAPAPN